MRRLERGFTLLEVLAVVALTSVVLGVALNFYIDLSNASQRATVHMRQVRRSTLLLDRIAHDLESTVLVRKPADRDPIDHPWLFFAERSLAEEGSDRIKFVSANHTPRSSDRHESDLEVVAYSVRRSAEDTLELLRWSRPRLPESLDRSLPGDESDGAQVMADDLESFSLRFLDDAGEWQEEWDSTTLLDSSELPRAVEIRLAVVDPDADRDGAFDAPEAPEPFSRTVLLPVRPLDIEVLLDPELAANRGRAGDGGEAGEGEEEEEGADGEGAEKEKDDRFAKMDCSDPSSPIQARTVEQCVNPAVLGSRVDELRKRFQPYLNDPYCRWISVIPTFLVHRSCLDGGLRPGGRN